MTGYGWLVRWAEAVLLRQIAEAQDDGALGGDGASGDERPQELLPLRGREGIPLVDQVGKEGPHAGGIDDGPRGHGGGS